MTKTPTAAVALCTLLAGASLPAQAQEAPCPMTYAVFETGVAHLDLEECPEAMAEEGTFCRASTANDLVTVFQFEADGEQCLTGAANFFEEDYTLTVE